MDQNLDNKFDFKSRIFTFYKQNKNKIKIFFVVIFIIPISILFLQIYNEKKNNLISEQYVKAGILYAGNEKDKSKELFEDILKSNNSFYSTLALNYILEKNLVKNEAKILEYFDKVEKLQKNQEQKDIIKFKKALFLIKKLNNKEAQKLLNELIESNSKIKNLAEGIFLN